MTSNTVDTVDTASLPVDDLHVVEPRAAGLDVHKMCITAAIRLYEAGTGVARAVVKEFSALPDGLRAMTDWLLAHGVAAAAMVGVRHRRGARRCHSCAGSTFDSASSQSSRGHYHPLVVQRFPSRSTLSRPELFGDKRTTGRLRGDREGMQRQQGQHEP